MSLVKLLGLREKVFGWLSKYFFDGLIKLFGCHRELARIPGNWMSH